MLVREVSNTCRCMTFVRLLGWELRLTSSTKSHTRYQNIALTRGNLSWSDHFRWVDLAQVPVENAGSVGVASFRIVANSAP